MTAGERRVKVRKWRRVLGRGLLLLLALVAALCLVLFVQGFRAFGKRPSGDRLLRMQRSPHYVDGRFVNPQPLVNDFFGMLEGMRHTSEHVSPSTPPPVARLSPRAFDSPPKSGLRVTWFGHSSMLIEVDGERVLTDPMWSERASPIPWLGPRRWYPAAVQLEELPKLTAVVISHDHYDHLDYRSVERLNALGVTFVVPLGVGAHLEYWGVPRARLIELDWWEKARLGGLEVVCTPARHASGRLLFDKDATLWAGYALVGARHRVYYSGDTGLFPAMRDIGERLGPFDVTLIETGQYHHAWPDWHIGPEQAVRAHELVRGAVMLPVHWALLGLAFHGWTEPGERASAAARQQQVELATPRPFEPFEPTSGTFPHERWWPSVPWETAEQHPIVSTGN
jgi:L-ascorbate metabolism protein UlaG (beta-lactamase superfamily)